MSIVWKVCGFILLVLSAIVMSPLLLFSGFSDARRYFAMRRM